MFYTALRISSAERANSALQLMNEHDYYIRALESVKPQSEATASDFARTKLNEALQAVKQQLHAMRIYP